MERFDKAKHKKSEILQNAVEALGAEAPNEALKTWVNERYAGFSWSGNPAAELGSAKKAAQKDVGSTETVKPERAANRPHAVPESAIEVPAAAESVPTVTANAVIKTLKRIAAMPADERAALDKALKAIEQFGSAEAAQVAIRKVTELMS